MGEIFDYFKTKKNLVSLLILGILILGIPLGVSLVRLQQIIKSRASVDPIVFTGPNVRQKSDGSWVATNPQIQFQMTSPLGPPGTPTPSPGQTPSPTPTPTVAPTAAPPTQAPTVAPTAAPTAAPSPASSVCTEAHPQASTTSATSGTFRVYASGITNAAKVLFPTWTTANGQDDIVWYQGVNDGGGNWHADIDLSKHPGAPVNIAVHVYVQSSNGTNTFCDTADFTRLAPPTATQCTATYALNPASPASNTSVSINTTAQSSNFGCVVLYQDGQRVSCRPGSATGNYACTANSGNSGAHTLQLKFGQTSVYGKDTSVCGQPVDCTIFMYQTR